MVTRFKVGDIVQLKSGGPKMTVIEIDVKPMTGGGPAIRCSWFAGAKSDRAAFPLDALVLAPEELQEKPKK